MKGVGARTHNYPFSTFRFAYSVLSSRVAKDEQAGDVYRTKLLHRTQTTITGTVHAANE